MNAAITTEWVLTIITVIPIGLVCWWLVRWHVQSWRRAVWEQCGSDITEVAHQLGGVVSARGRGWCVIFADKLGTVRWEPSLSTSNTRIRRRYLGKPDLYESVQGLAPAPWVLKCLRRDLIGDSTDLE